MGRLAAAPGRRKRRGGRDDEGLGPRGEVCGRHGGTRREECVVSGCGQGEECGGEEGGGREGKECGVLAMECGSEERGGKERREGEERKEGGEEGEERM